MNIVGFEFTGKTTGIVILEQRVLLFFRKTIGRKVQRHYSYWKWTDTDTYTPGHVVEDLASKAKPYEPKIPKVLLEED